MEKKKYNVAVVGATGLVGGTFLKVLAEEKFPINKLVLLASELNVIVYINSHSPFVMEALSLYSEYYGIINDANFYLTEKDEEKKD